MIYGKLMMTRGKLASVQSVLSLLNVIRRGLVKMIVKH